MPIEGVHLEVGEVHDFQVRLLPQLLKGHASCRGAEAVVVSRGLQVQVIRVPVAAVNQLQHAVPHQLPVLHGNALYAVGNGGFQGQVDPVLLHLPALYIAAVLEGGVFGVNHVAVGAFHIIVKYGFYISA